MIKVGLIVNPIAGMGGKVGLKGTDGDMYKKALELGAEPTTSKKIEDVLKLIERNDLHFLTAPGEMGENHLNNFNFEFEVVGEIEKETKREDTKKIAQIMADKEIKVLIFVGGDGTARDILDIVGTNIPVIAIPSGVKMFSSAFVFSAHAAAEMINSFGDDFLEKEILDIDEKAFRENRLDAQFYGTVRVPNFKQLLQGKKSASVTDGKIKDKKREVAKYVTENMEKDCVYILGPGTTVKEIADIVGIEKTLLGIDAICNNKLIGADITEKDIIKLTNENKKVKIIVTPIGGSVNVIIDYNEEIIMEVKY